MLQGSCFLHVSTLLIHVPFGTCFRKVKGDNHCCTSLRTTHVSRPGQFRFVWLRHQTLVLYSTLSPRLTMPGFPGSYCCYHQACGPMASTRIALRRFLRTEAIVRTSDSRLGFTLCVFRRHAAPYLLCNGASATSPLGTVVSQRPSNRFGLQDTTLTLDPSANDEVGRAKTVFGRLVP